MSYKLAIFDMDGTILDTLNDLTDSVNYALEASGFPKRTISEVKSFVGNGIRKLVERAVPDNIREDEKERVYEQFTKYYKLHCADTTKPYDGILETISTLRKRGILTAVVSNKADYAVQDLCEKYFKSMFDMAVGAKDGVPKKPFPDAVNDVLRRLRVSAEDAVYIGDSDIDIETALNAKTDSIIVSWGFREREYLIKKGARVLADTPEELLNLIIS